MPMRWRWPPENWRGIAVHEARAAGRPGQQVRDRLARFARGLPIPKTCMGSAMMSAMLPARAERAVWILEDHLHVAPHGPHRAADSAVRSVPSIADAARAGLDQPQHRRPSVDLPQPDSPTTASVSPLLDRRSETPSTARTSLRFAPSEAAVLDEVLARPRRASSGRRSLASWRSSRRAQAAHGGLASAPACAHVRRADGDRRRLLGGAALDPQRAARAERRSPADGPAERDRCPGSGKAARGRPSRRGIECSRPRV